MKKVLGFSVACAGCLSFAATLTFAPGENVTTNVTGVIGGAYDALAVNVPNQRGGIVNLLNPLSFYTGAPTVYAGTLALSDLAPIDSLSVLGRGTPGDAITLKDGTLHYMGAPAETDRGLTIAPADPRHGSIVSVAKDTSLKITGPFKVEQGTFVKTGGGTLHLSSTQGGVSNAFTKSLSDYDGLPDFSANGDALTRGFSGFTVFDGRLVVETPATATNYFRADQNGAVLYVGRTSTQAADAEGSASLDFRGGVNLLPRVVYVGYKAGDTTTAHETRHHAINIHSGIVDNYTSNATIYLGYSCGKDVNNFVSHLNIYGGELKTQFLRPGDTKGTVSRLFMSGGKLSAYGIYPGHTLEGLKLPQTWDDPDIASIPVIDIDVTSNALMHITGPIYMCRDGLVNFTFRLLDGGKLRCRGFHYAAGESLRSAERMTLIADGGELVTRDNASSASYRFHACQTVKIGEKGLLWENGVNTIVESQLMTLDGVAYDGGITLINGGTLNLLGPTSFKGPLTVRDTANLILKGALSADYVEMADGRLGAAAEGATVKALRHATSVGNFTYPLYGGSVAKLTLQQWTPPNMVCVHFPTLPANGTYDLIDYPAIVSLDPRRIVFEGASIQGKRVSFSVKTAGAVSTLCMTLEAVSQGTVSPQYVWQAAAGGDWDAASSWQGASAPVPGTTADISFAAIPAAGSAVAVSVNSEAKLSALHFPAAGNYRLAGTGSLDLGNNNAAVKVTAAGAATNAIDVPLTVQGSVVFDIPPKGRMLIAKMSGNADIKMSCSKIDGGNGFGGTMKIDSFGAYSGSFDFPSGLLEMGQIPANLSHLRIGFGEFRYSGAADATLPCPVDLCGTQYATTKLGVYHPDATLTLSDNIRQNEGSLWKTGPGTLVLNGAHDYAFGLVSAYYGVAPYTTPMGWLVKDTWVWDSNGRTCTYNSFMVAGGTMRMGVPGQTVRVGANGLVVGGNTTAEPGKEYDATLEIAGGKTVVDGDITVSFNHGNLHFNTPSKERLTATLKVAGGTLGARNMEVGRQEHNQSRADARYEQTGGDVHIKKWTTVGRNGKDSPAYFEMAGGTFLTSVLRLGEYDSCKTSEVTVAGGTLSVTNDIVMRYGRTRLNLLEGGTLRACSVVHEPSITVKDCAFYANGGTLKPLLHDPLGYVSTGVKLGEKGLVVDLSEFPRRYFDIRSVSTAEGVSQDGGIRVRSDAYRLGALSFNVPNAFTGEIVVEKGGNVRSYLAILTNQTVRVKDGGAFGSQWTSLRQNTSVASLSLGENEGDRTILQIQTAWPAHESLFTSAIFVRDALQVKGSVEVVFADSVLDDYVTPMGDLTILIAPKGTIDAAKFTIDSEYGPKLSGSFSVAGYDSRYDKLVLTLTGTTSRESVWTASGSGAWSEVPNWSVLPQNREDEKITFPATLAGDATVSMGGSRTLGALALHAEKTVVLEDGALVWRNAYPEISTVSNGMLVLPALASASRLNVNTTPSSGKVRLTGDTASSPMRVAGGTLQLSAGATGNGVINVNNATLSVTGSGRIDHPVKIEGLGGIIHTTDDAFFMQDVFMNTSSALVKTGPGTAYLASSNPQELLLANRGGIAVDANNANKYDQDKASTAVPDNGDIPADSLGGALTIAAGKLVVGVNPNQKLKIGTGRFDLGQSYFECDENGNIVPSSFEMYGGRFTANDLNIGRNPSVYTKIAAHKGKPRYLNFTLWDGVFTCQSLYMWHAQRGTPSGVATLNVHGGTMTVKGSYIALGYTFKPALTNVINVTGGRLDFTTDKFAVNGNKPINGNLDLNMRGGVLSSKLPFLVNEQNDTGHFVNFNFAGGTLAVPCIYRVGHQNGFRSRINLLWDGGIYQPSSNNFALVGAYYPWTKNECRAGGAKFDLSAIKGTTPAVFTCDQPFTHQEGLATDDGGVEMLGGGTLVLSAVNTMTGPVTVSGGTVKGTVAGAAPALVLKGGMFDGATLAHEIRYLKGSGGSAENGELVVTDEIAPLAGADAQAPYATVSKLACGEDARIACAAAQENADMPYFRVTESCRGVFTCDFGRTAENPLSLAFRVKVAECPAQSLMVLRGVNTGVERRFFVTAEYARNEETGLVDVYAVLRPQGTVLLFK